MVQKNALKSDISTKKRVLHLLDIEIALIFFQGIIIKKGNYTVFIYLSIDYFD